MSVARSSVSVGARSSSRRVERGLFGALNVMTETGHSTRASRALEVCLIVLDTYQLLSLVVDAASGWHPPLVSLFQTFSLARLIAIRASYALFVSCWFAVFLVVFGSMADAAYVSYSFHNNRHRYLWPVKLLRYLVKLSITACFIPFLSVLLLPFQCSRVHTFDGAPECDSFAHVVVTSASTLCLLVFFPVCLITTLVGFQPDPFSRQLKAGPLGRIDFMYTIVRATLVIVDALTSSISLKAAIAVILLGAVLVNIALYLPFYRSWVNRLRSALIACGASLRDRPQPSRTPALSLLTRSPQRRSTHAALWLALGTLIHAAPSIVTALLFVVIVCMSLHVELSAGLRLRLKELGVYADHQQYAGSVQAPAGHRRGSARPDPTVIVRRIFDTVDISQSRSPRGSAACWSEQVVFASGPERAWMPRGEAPFRGELGEYPGPDNAKRGLCKG